jgi:Ca2+-transporting ATPase
MGMRGTEVAKEASDIVLTDDNFSTIVSAIEGGRTIYSNIIKFVHLMFSHNLGEVLVIFAAIVSGLSLPLLPLQILWVNLVTDVFPALALAMEPASNETMKRPPRPPDENLVSSRFLLLIGWQGAMLAGITLLAYIWALDLYGPGSHSRTVAMLAIVGVQIGHTFNCRSRTRSIFIGFFRNPYLFAAAAGVLLLQALAIYVDPLSSLLDLVEPNQYDLLVVLACVVLPVLIVETSKAIVRPRPVPVTAA